MDIELRNVELLRKTAIEGVVEKQKNQEDAAARLEISEEHIQRKLRNYRGEGVVGFLSRKRSVPSDCKMEAAIRKIVEGFINDPLVRGFGLFLMAEKLSR